ncbi:hypothetical protein TD95_004015 [Thielaviopsis punctulata]|uniref:Major facilitator superfamily (MFS) profile domain-containing protein n=1 Tax=Thielaviopsis punctulata TaxID=72032 RepID=A0A0F4Z881_9PEZI|nr:hypothetical protein TD95_004015 [Thielaviopsis punctulata]
MHTDKKPIDDEAGHHTVSEAEEEAEAVSLPPQRPRWNHDAVHVWRVVAVMYGFFVMGVGDGCIGALLPYIEKYYSVSYTLVSLLFLTPCLGYLIAGLLNTHIHHHLGQRGIALLAPLLHTAAYLALALRPPSFPAIPPLVFLAGLASGLQDSAWNAWLASLARENELLGLAHALYGLGATAAPLAATAVVARAPWCVFFAALCGLAGLEGLLNAIAFRAASAREYRAALSGAARPRTRNALRRPAAWLLAVFMLGYVGVEVSLGGWTTTYMLRERRATHFLAGLAATLYWLGITLGRLVLGFVTGRVGERVAVVAYLALSIGLQLLFWRVDNTAAAVTFVVLMGFFLGPLFPAAIARATKVLRRDYHVGAIGVGSAAGGVGGALLPFAIGALAARQDQGVAVLQVVVLVVLVVITAVWMFFCQVPAESD